ncbi:MAG: hypothetical protein AAF471_09225 [Myxococcota bacterium]
MNLQVRCVQHRQSTSAGAYVSITCGSHSDFCGICRVCWRFTVGAGVLAHWAGVLPCVTAICRGAPVFGRVRRRFAVVRRCFAA